jgi:hypothetical protein
MYYIGISLLLLKNLLFSEIVALTFVDYIQNIRIAVIQKKDIHTDTQKI